MVFLNIILIAGLYPLWEKDWPKQPVIVGYRILPVFIFWLCFCATIDIALNTLYENFVCLHNYYLMDSSKTGISGSASIKNVRVLMPFPKLLKRVVWDFHWMPFSSDPHRFAPPVSVWQTTCWAQMASRWVWVCSTWHNREARLSRF